MALRHTFSAFAGAPDFFRGMGAKKYGDVLENSKQRFSGAKDKEYRMGQMNAFENSLKSNPDLSPAEIRQTMTGYKARNFLNAGAQFLARGVAGTSSAIGGTFGYGLKFGGIAAGKGVAKMSKGAYSATEEAVKRAASKERTPRPKMSPEERMARAERRGERMKFAGQAGRAAGRDAKALAKDAYNISGSPLFGVGAVAVGVGLVAADSEDLSRTIGAPFGDGVAGHLTGSVGMPVYNAYESGMNMNAAQRKLGQMEANMELSHNGGGAFIRDIATPPAGVDNKGASGDLVFALHSLRNGG